jgi:gas vesicle protein
MEVFGSTLPSNLERDMSEEADAVFIAALVSELQRSKAARAHVDEQIKFAAKALDNLEMLFAEALAVRTKAKLLLGQFSAGVTNSIDLVIAQLKHPLDLTDVRQKAEEGVRELGGWRDEAISAMNDASDEIRETLQDLSGSFREATIAELDKVNGLVTSLAEEYQENAEEFLERVEELQDSSSEMLEEHFMNALPDGVKEQGEALVEGVKTLKENGVDQISKLTSAVGVIRDKTKVLMDAVEAVKPVLDVARQIM